MPENYFVFFPIPIQRILSHSLVFATITTASVIFSTLGLSSKAAAQDFTVNKKEVTNYAQSVLSMEPARQQAFDEIKKLIGEKEVPQIVCNDVRSIDSLPSKARDIAVNYCNRSQKIVENNGLSIERFNKITLELQNNSDLKRQVYNTLILLQKDSEKK
jgi:Domain of unknown function (DUF4168)